MTALYMCLLSIFTMVELNCENLFDCKHDSLKEDTEFLPESYRHWTSYRYWSKLNHLSQEIVACGNGAQGWSLPDIVALCEVENDSVMNDLTCKSSLRTLRYRYVMTNSPDRRGIDVALLYSPYSFALLSSYSISVTPLPQMSPTRDILYVSGQVMSGDTLHIFVVHAPGRWQGEAVTRPYRVHVAQQLCRVVDSIRCVSPDARIVLAGDFNDYTDDASLQLLSAKGFVDVSAHAQGTHGAKGTYRYKGEWGSLDHILVSSSLLPLFNTCEVYDAPFLLCPDEKYGGVQPFRCYQGGRYRNGFSDHLPLVARFDMSSL